MTNLTDVVDTKKRKIFEHKLAHCEEYSNRFTSSNIPKKDALVFSAFLVNHLIKIIDAVAHDDTDEDLVTTLKYLDRLSEKISNTFMVDII